MLIFLPVGRGRFINRDLVREGVSRGSCRLMYLLERRFKLRNFREQCFHISDFFCILQNVIQKFVYFFIL